MRILLVFCLIPRGRCNSTDIVVVPGLHQIAWDRTSTRAGAIELITHHREVDHDLWTETERLGCSVTRNIL